MEVHKLFGDADDHEFRIPLPWVALYDAEVALHVVEEDRAAGIRVIRRAGVRFGDGMYFLERHEPPPAPEFAAVGVQASDWWVRRARVAHTENELAGAEGESEFVAKLLLALANQSRSSASERRDLETERDNLQRTLALVLGERNAMASEIGRLNDAMDELAQRSKSPAPAVSTPLPPLMPRTVGIVDAQDLGSRVFKEGDLVDWYDHGGGPPTVKVIAAREWLPGPPVPATYVLAGAETAERFARSHRVTMALETLLRVINEVVTPYTSSLELRYLARVYMWTLQGHSREEYVDDALRRRVRDALRALPLPIDVLV